jgi:hypothetical protein
MDERATETVSGGSSGKRPGIDFLIPGTRLGERWEVVRMLGRGGFSVVYLAVDHRLGREVALKVLRDDRLSAGSLRRFRREAVVARDLAHPRLVRIFDIEEAGGAIFLTLEAVAGGSLRDRIRAGPLPVEPAVRIASGLFEALAALHGVGIVHRDVKPGNVLLTESGEVKLADFGMALDLEREETRVTASEATVGTLEYLSPEQAMGEEVDARSDLYAAGIVLFEMLSARLPHGGRSSLGSLLARFRQRPPSLRDLRPETPRWLAAIVERLLERRPEDRYPSARAVLADLARRRARVAPTRRRLLALAGALAASTLAAAGVWGVAEHRARQFSHVVWDDVALVATAVDRRGETLWTREDVHGQRNLVPFRLSGRGLLRIAAVQADDAEPDLERTRVLEILDPRSGEVTGRLDLAEASSEFPEFSSRYRPSLTAVDLDGDDADELIVDFAHELFWPSFSVLVEPRLRRSRVVLVASGHHWFKRAEDLDGDGLPELLYAGINNRLGWHQAVAAVRPPHDLGATGQGGGWTAAMSADRSSRMGAATSLVWYALAPRGLLSTTSANPEIDRAHREIRLDYAKRAPYILDFDGFEVEGAHVEGHDRRSRYEARQRAYLALAEGRRLEEALELAGAAAAYGEAHANATRARMPLLELWLRQSRNRARAAFAPASEVEAEMEELIRRSEHPSEIAFDTARALHRAGRVEEALVTYRRSFTLGGVTDGRGEYEIFEGIVLALAELGRFDEAATHADRLCHATSLAPDFCNYFPLFVEWARGRRLVLSELPPLLPGVPDLQRYWLHEARLVAGERIETLRAEVARELEAASGQRYLFESLLAELLGRAGRVEEAAERSAAAREQLERALARDFTARFHAPLVRERATRWRSTLGTSSR